LVNVENEEASEYEQIAKIPKANPRKEKAEHGHFCQEKNHRIKPIQQIFIIIIQRGRNIHMTAEGKVKSCIFRVIIRALWKEKC